MSQAVLQRIIRDHIIHVFENNQNEAFTVDEVHKQIAEHNTVDTSQVLNHLRQIISTGKIRVVYPAKDIEPQRFKYVPPAKQEAFIDLDDDSHRIYDLIDKSGNKGIWRRDLKKAGGSMSEKRINAVLKELETRYLIKSISSIHEKKLKLYLLYDVVPSEEITGGVWYLEGTFNTSFVEQLVAQSINIVHTTGGITLKDMVERIKSNSIVTAHISDKEAEQVINAIVHTKRVTKQGTMLKPGIIDLPICPTSEVPCNGCPVAASCFPGGPINPRECPYLQKLTELF
jgi:DNA-directed RNA polymerase III subunit RPC6